MPWRARTSGGSPHTSASSTSQHLTSAPAEPALRTHRVLKIAPTSFFADYGCHVRIYEETRALQSLGHRVTICTYHTGRDLPDVDVRRALNTPGQHTVRVGSSKRKVYYDGLLALKSTQVAWQMRPTVVHAHLHEGALIGAPIAKALGVPLVFATNPLFWQWHQVDLDGQRVRVELYNEAPVELPWSDVVGARHEPGKLYPLFVDDAALVLVAKDGRTARVLRGPLQPRAVVALVRAQLHTGSAK